MKPEEINRAVWVEMGAKWYVFRDADSRPFYDLLIGKPEWIERHGGEEMEPSEGDDTHMANPPNFFADLNACREMEEKAMQDLFNSDEWSAYGKWLSDLHPTAVISPASHAEDANDFYYELASIANAPASTRCEAFLRVKGKWIQ